MRLKQHFVVPYPRDLVWKYFGEVEDVTRCMPGAALTEPPQGNRVKFQLKVKLGPIAAAFVGEADLDRNDEAYRGALRGSGRDDRSGSRAKGEVVYQLAEEDGGAATGVDVTVDYSLAGSLAQFSRAGIVNDLAQRLSAEFAGNLEDRLARASGTQPGGTGTPDTGQGPAPIAEPAAELHAGKLLWSVIWARIRRLFRRTPDRG